MNDTITMTMPEILIDRMNATREERLAFMKAAARCAYMEAQMESILIGYGFSVEQTDDGYKAAAKEAMA